MDDRIFPYEWEQKIIPHPKDKILLADFEDGDEIKYANYEDFKGEKGSQVVSATIDDDDIIFSLDDGTTAALVDGAKDLKGKDGDEVELRVDSNNIEWKLSQDIARTVLTPLSAIKGDTGAKIVGADWDGNNMKFTLDDSSTVSLVNAKIDLKGDKGEPGDTGSPGAPGNDGADGKEVELQTTPTHIQWKYDTDISRNNLVLLSDLKGADGSDGSDGREIQLQTNATHIQWKYDTDVVWNDLIALSILKGDKGDDGAKINGVSWDNNDMKFTLNDASSVSLTNAKTDLKGDKGDSGPIGMQWKGVWIAGSYDKNDGVSYQGSSYIANKNTSQTPGGSDWDILAQQGQGGAGSGDMLASVYDPTNKAVDAFDFDNFYNTPTASDYDIANLSDTGGLRSSWTGKQDKLTAGNNVDITNNVVSSTNTTYQSSDFDIKDLADTTNLKSTWSGKQDSLGFTPENSANKGVASGYASLDANAKIPANQIPALAITETFVVASQVAQLALNAEEGDVAIRTDENKTYIHNGGIAGTMADWTAMLTPAGGVTSVATGTGLTGGPITSTGTISLDSTTVASLGKADTAIQDISMKQDTLVSGTNIKTVNGTTILGSGNIVVGGDPDAVTSKTDDEPTGAMQVKNMVAIGEADYDTADNNSELVATTFYLVTED